MPGVGDGEVLRMEHEIRIEEELLATGVGGA